MLRYGGDDEEFTSREQAFARDITANLATPPRPRALHSIKSSTIPHISNGLDI